MGSAQICQPPLDRSLHYGPQLLARLLKDSAEIIAKPLTTLINASLIYGRVPSEWKWARVNPLFKNGKANDMDNYRPISILPTLSKVLERVVHAQLYDFLAKEKLLSPYQCGFRKGHSTELAVLSFTDSIRRSMDQGLLTGAVFIDLRKAFNTVDHDLLLEKLAKGYGVTGKELGWFKDYLTDRRQVVTVQSTLSDPCDVAFGVPQGSILGPLLFVLFINDLPTAISKCNILLYADDAVIFAAHKDIKILEETLNDELNEVNKWTLSNFLFINKRKTEFVIFGTDARLSKVTDKVIIKIGDYEINRVYDFKYLGIVLDDSLTWKDHVRYVISRVGKRVGVLGRLRKNITIHAALEMYKSLILPILDYCDVVWASCNKVDIERLESLQRRASKIIVKSKCSTTSIDYLKFQSLEDRRNTHILGLVKRCLNNKVPQFLKNYFKLNKEVISRETRRSNFIYLPAVRTETAKKSFYYNGSVVYNNYLVNKN